MADQPRARRSEVTRVWPPVEAPERRTVAQEADPDHRHGLFRAREADEPVPLLPEEYGISRLVLLVRDPWWVHAYWRLTTSDREYLRVRSGEGRRLVLRVQETGESAVPGRHVDFTVDAGNGNWYIDVQFADRSYQAILGLLSGEGRFEPFLASNTVHTPPDTLSAEMDAEWATSAELYGYVLRQPLVALDGSLALVERGREGWYRRQLAVSSLALASPGLWRQPAGEGAADPTKGR